jgi:3-oxoacid CoA-transferase B subunit
VIAEVTEIVEVGALDPDKVHIPGIYVDAVVKTEIPVEVIRAEGRAVARDPLKVGSAQEVIGIPRDLMALRAAREIAQMQFVNLGIGIPTLIGRWLAELDAPVQLHAENGLLGYQGREDADGWNWNWYDAGSMPVDVIGSTSTFDSVSAFTMARGGHLDMVVLGGYEVAANGDLANWKIPGSKVGGIGGAMDLIAGGSPVMVVMQHTTKTGEPRLLRECTLPLTGIGCVTTIVTNLAVVDVGPEGFSLREVAPGVTVEEVVAATDAPLAVSGEVPTMALS